MDKICPVVPLPLDEVVLADLMEDAKDFAFSHGLVFKLRKVLPYDYSVTFIPFALLPSPWPKDQYDMVCQLQKDINLIYYRVSNNFDFLKKSLQQICEFDEWTRRLWQIYERTYESQKDVLSLCIMRSDYMVGHDGLAKQIEVNTISAGFGGVSPIMLAQHKYIMSKLHLHNFRRALPENAGTRVALGLAQAWEAYGNREAVICFVVEDVVYNTYDQRQKELALTEKYGIDTHLIVRKKNSDLLRVCVKDGKLFLDNIEIAVVYMRTWYDPSQINSEELWRIRELIEKSRAIKCPNIAWHLSGSKKIQQELARPGVLERFCDDVEQVRRVRSVFAGLYVLEEAKTLEMVLADPERFVLKPQREGGGHNIYGRDIVPFLKSLPAPRRHEFIAMDIIEPVSCKNYLVNRDKITFTEVANELGIFGYVLGDFRRIVHNEANCGWIFRAKDAKSTEGGIAAGYGHLDSPSLV
ncbi:glutathione synthetase-like [Varroa jacobsoni]|uniref:Glutathione synthetase n=1 Tax=Varroa destructor TaxID=109461 RepID=A0A7M7K8T2_VARDE|nr:glutathione synthetase-like [Varroa destructor]XP_022710135.1 glutathione synthetase-like [Varroa jacobsoni]